MIGLLLAAAMLQAPDPCSAAERGETFLAGCPQWRLLQPTPQGASYVDPASARRDGLIVEVTARTVTREPEEDGTRSIHGRVRLDCAARTRQVVHLTSFDAAGRQLMDAPITNDRPTRPSAGSSYARLLSQFCPPAGGQP